MKEIIELNKRILSEAPEIAQSEEGLIIYRTDPPAELPGLTDALIAELERMRTQLNSRIPDDFSYVLNLGVADPDFKIEYEDGAMGASCPLESSPNGSIFEQLESVDWDEMRAQAILGCQIYDSLKETAVDIPAGIPTTRQLQRAFREDMNAWVKEKRKDSSRVHVFVWRKVEEICEEEAQAILEDFGEEALTRARKNEDGFHEFTFDTLEAFGGELPNHMTMGFQVITVVADGKPIPAARIDQFKGEALKKLEDMPISHAKASGKF